MAWPLDDLGPLQKKPWGRFYFRVVATILRQIKSAPKTEDYFIDQHPIQGPSGEERPNIELWRCSVFRQAKHDLGEGLLFWGCLYHEPWVCPAGFIEDVRRGIKFDQYHVPGKNCDSAMPQKRV